VPPQGGGKDINMEQIREIITEPEEKVFRTSIFGFNKKDTVEYISTFEENLKSSVENYEKKLSDQANSLTMALREKETLTKKVEELQKMVSVLSIDIDEQKSSLVVENNALKERIQAFLEIESKNKLLLEEMEGLKSRCEYCEAERQGLFDTITEKDEVILKQCKNNAESERLLKTEMNQYKTQYESVRKVQTLNIQSAKKGLNKVIYIIEQL